MATFVTYLEDGQVAKLMKERYAPLGSNVHAIYDDILRQIPKKIGTFGKRLEKTFEITLAGSVGSAGFNQALPESNTADTVMTFATPKRHYARARMDALAMYDGKGGEDSLVDVMDREIKGKITSFNWNRARNFFNDTTGVLGQFSAIPIGTAELPLITILDTGRYRRRPKHFEARNYVHIGSAGAPVSSVANPPFTAPFLGTLFEIIKYTNSTGVLELRRVSGFDDLTALPTGVHYNVYMQGSQNNDRTGLLDVAYGQAGGLYGLAYQDRYRPFGFTDGTYTAIGELSLEMLTDVAENYGEETGESFNLVICHPIQARKFKSLMQAERIEVNINTVSAKMSPGFGQEKVVQKVGTSGIEVVTANGSFTLVSHRLMRADMVIFLNTKKIEDRNIMTPQWMTKDGSMWDRLPNHDIYEARYACYGETIFDPYHFAFIDGLPTTAGF